MISAILHPLAKRYRETAIEKHILAALPTVLFIVTHLVMSQSDSCVKGLIRYCLPDLGLPAAERSFYSFPANKLVKEEWQQLNDYRNALEVVKGPRGLDIQGFTYVKHTSSLSTDKLLTGRNAEDVYLKEVTDLICEVTGANRAVVDGVAFGQKKPTQETTDHYHVSKRGSDMVVALSKIARDKVRGKNRCTCRDWTSIRLTNEQHRIGTWPHRVNRHALHTW